jgi:hypothetical protein
MRMNEFMKDEAKNELLQLLNQFFASKFAAPQAQPTETDKVLALRNVAQQKFDNK